MQGRAAPETTPLQGRAALAAIVCVCATVFAADAAAASHSSVLGAEAPAVYYVSLTGNDSAKGTSPTTAWRTIGRVNMQGLRAGDTVLFRGGASFPGLLYLNPAENGTATAPITFDSYGGGRATIAGGAGGAIFAYNVGGIVIRNLVLTGSGAGVNMGDGLGFYNDLAGNVKRQYVRITNVSVSGFGHYGIVLGGWNGSSGFQDVRVSYSDVHDNGRAGLTTYGPGFQPGTPSYANSDVYVGHVAAYNNLGDPTLSTNSGSGIVLGSVSNGVIERSVAHDNGALCHGAACGVGIWAYDSTRITIQSNESYQNRTGGPVDGGGFDLDQNTSNSTLQYNYSHDNDGAGYLLYTGRANSAWSGNTVRYNVSQNDGRKNSYGSILAGGRIYNSAVYQNTIYVSPASSGAPPAVRILSLPGAGIGVRNNILYVTGGLRMVSAPALALTRLVFQQNDYYSPSAKFKVVWGSTTYTTLGAWQSATGEEKLNGSAVGMSVDPRLVSPGGGGTIGDADALSSLTAYRLQPTTPVLDRGLDLLGLFGILTGGQDFFGVPVPSHLGADIGAAELP